MKKNKMMRIASALLIAVLLTTSVISGTFAKYVTSGSATDSARVAKFGVTIEGSGALFAKNYYSVGWRDNAPDMEGIDDDASITALTVESQDADNVVAPGTKGPDNGVSFSVKGTPEVDVRIALTIDLANSKDIFLGSQVLPDMTTSDVKDDVFGNPDTYYPIRYTLSGAIVATLKDEIEAAKTGAVVRKNGTATGTLAQIAAVLDVINGKDGGVYVEAGTDLSTVGNGLGDLTLTWAWAFEDNTDAAAKKLQDQRDTLLGDFIAQKKGDEVAILPALPEGYVEGVAYNLDTNVKLVLTVTQVD